jgi:hypothetical protein
MKERLQFVARRRDDGRTLQGVRDVAQDRHKIFDCYRECGLEGLTDRIRRLYRYVLFR